MGLRLPILKSEKLKIIFLMLIISSILLSTFMSVNAGLFGEKIKKISDNELEEIKFELNLSKDPNFYSYTDSILKETLDKEINSQETPGLTFGSFILNALYEEKLVEMCYPNFDDKESSLFFSKLADNLSNWRKNFANKTTKIALQGVIEAYLKMPKLGVGTSTLFLAIDLAQINVAIAKLAKVVHNRALYNYLGNRCLAPLHDHESAWGDGIPLLWSPEKKQSTEKFFQSLWSKYGEAILSDNLDIFKKQQHEFLRVLILQALNRPPNPPTNMIQFKSDGKTILKIGKTTTEKTVIFKAKVSDPVGNKARLQIELRRLDEYEGKFDEEKGGLQQSDLFKNNSEIMISVYGLADGDYHWRARTIDEYGLSSEWVSFGGNPDSAVDFSIGQEVIASVITSPLKITPDPPHYVGDTINAEFNITNKDATSITFSVLTVGGRDPDNHVADFTHRQNITLEPSKSYNYQGTLTLNKAGDYHFFCTYQAPDGNWNTCIDLDSGLFDEDRTEDINVKVVKESEIVPDKKVYTIQVGAFSKEEGAQKLAKEIRDKGYQTYVIKGKTLYKVQVGEFKSYQEAQNISQKLKELGYPIFITTTTRIERHVTQVEQTAEISKTTPIITSPLKITPDPPYHVGDTINAEFTIANQSSLPIKFSVLTVGGRDPDNHVSDFTLRQNITLEPSKSYNYQETLTLNKGGDYHFFCTYQTPDGDWNTCIDLGSGLVDEDRIEDINVKEKGETQLLISEELKVSAPPEVIWSRELYEPWPRYIMQTPDGGYIFASGGGCDRGFIGLIKLDSFGQKTGESRLRYRCPWVLSLQKTPDGGYILLAFADEIGGTEFTMYLIKTDASGHKIWDKRFNEKDQSGRESDIIRYLEVGRGVEPYFFAEQTPDGGYILAGVIYYKDSEKYHPWLIKTDSKGDKQWEKIFEEEGVISSLQQTSDGGYILVVRGWLIKTDASGQKVFKKIFEEKKAHRLQQTSDGGYILAGVIDKDSKHYPWLMKTNSSVDEQWEKIFEDEIWPYFVQQTPDGGYILVGNTKDNIKLIKTDASGQKIWKWTEKAEPPELESFQQTSDGGYIVLMDSQLIKLGSLEETQKEQVTEFFEEFKEEAKKEISPYHVEYKPIVTANIFTDLLVNISGPADELGIILTNPEGWSTTRFISKRDLIDNFESVKVSLCKEENPPSGIYNLTIKTITLEKTVYQKEIRFSPPVLEIIDAKVRIIEIEGSPIGGVYIGRGHYLTDVDIVVKNWGDLPLILRRIVITLRGRKTQEMNLDQFKGVPYGETKIKEGGKRGSYLWNFDEDIFHSAVIKLYSFSEKDCLAEYQAELRVDRYDSLWDADVDY